MNENITIRPTISRPLVVMMMILVVIFSVIGAATVYLDGEIGNMGLIVNQLFQGIAVFLLYFYLM